MLDVLIRAGSFVAVIFLGFILRKIGMFRKEDFKVLSNVVLKITLPAAIVVSFANTQLTPDMLVMVLLGFGIGVVYMLAAYLINLKKTSGEKGFAIINLSGSNVGCFAMPFIQSFLGPAAVVATSLFDSGNAIVVLGGSYGVASTIKEGSGLSFKRLFKSLLTSVPFLFYLVLTALKILNVNIPSQVVDFVQPVANANAFMAMLMIGVGFELSADKTQLKKIVKIVALRYSIGAVFALTAYFLMPFSQDIRNALVLLALSPVGSSAPIFTQMLGEDEGLASAVNSICILISVVINVILLTVLL